MFGLRKCDVTGFTKELPITINISDAPSFLKINRERSKKSFARAATRHRSAFPIEKRC